jgi:hypothetical protein
VRATFVRGIEAVFFCVIISLIFGFITIGFNETSQAAPVKPTGLVAMEKDEIQQIITTQIVSAETRVNQLEELNFEPPLRKDARLPKDTLEYNSKIENLLLMLHEYYFMSEDRMLEESVEYVERESGYIRTGMRNDANYTLSHVGKHIKYLLALTKYKKLNPTMSIFDDDYDRMNSLVKKIFETHPAQTRYTMESFFDLLDLYEITRDSRYLTYADYINNVGRLTSTAEQRSLFEQQKAPRTLSPTFFNDVVLLQEYAEMGEPLFVQAARTLYDGLMKGSFNENINMFYTQLTYPSADNANAKAIKTYKTTELAIALHRMMDYYELTEDEAIIEKVGEIISEFNRQESKLFDFENGLFYDRYIESKSQYTLDPKRPDVNLLIYSALVRYMLYYDDWEYLKIVQGLSGLINDRAYDENYNGFYSRYDNAWNPEPVNDFYELSLTDAILAVQVFLNNEEVQRNL